MKPNNPQAFPIDSCTRERGMEIDERSGMTLRDYFAAKALQGWISNENYVNNINEMDYAVKMSYKTADAMLKQREIQQ